MTRLINERRRGDESLGSGLGVIWPAAAPSSFLRCPKTYDSQSNSLFSLKPAEASVLQAKARFIGQPLIAFAKCKRRRRKKRKTS